MKRLRIALPSGSLFEATLNLLARIGIIVKFGNREFMVRVENDDLAITFILDRPQDIPLGIIREDYDAGICGWDCVVESGLEAILVLISELAYAKKSRRIAEVVIFGKATQLIDAENIVVATEFMKLARAYFKKAQLILSHGCTESKVLYGGYHFGICITETGESLKANGLKIIKTILRSPTVLVAKEETLEIKIFGEILCGALVAEKRVILKCDCAVDIKDAIVEGLPAIESPTVNQLGNGNFAIETVLSRDDLAGQLIRLRLAGATGIIVQDFNILI